MSYPVEFSIAPRQDADARQHQLATPGLGALTFEFRSKPKGLYGFVAEMSDPIPPPPMSRLTGEYDSMFTWWLYIAVEWNVTWLLRSYVPCT